MSKTALLVLSLAAVFYSAIAVAPVCPTSDSNDVMMFADAEDCSTYYLCSNGVPYEMHCAPGLYYNIELRTCDYKQNVACNWRKQSASSS